MNKMFIDAENMQAGLRIYHALKRLKTTEAIKKPVNYRFSTIQDEVKIILETSMGEDQLNNWLYTRKAGDGYIGCGPLGPDE